MKYSSQEIRIAFGTVLSGVRKYNKITKCKAHDVHGLCASSLVNWERGSVAISFDNFFRVCDAFNIKPSRMLSLVEYELNRRKHDDKEADADS